MLRRGLVFHRPRPGGPLAVTLAPALAALLYAASPRAAEHVIATRGNQWAPIVTFIEVGDSIVWTGMTSHETQLVAGLHPEPVAAWGSELNEEGFRVTFERPGAYVYQCHVHLAAGMIGAVVVGPLPPENLRAIEAAAAALGAERVFIQRVVGRMKLEIDRRYRR